MHSFHSLLALQLQSRSSPFLSNPRLTLLTSYVQYICICKCIGGANLIWKSFSGQFSYYCLRPRNLVHHEIRIKSFLSALCMIFKKGFKAKFPGCLININISVSFIKIYEFHRTYIGLGNLFCAILICSRKNEGGMDFCIALASFICYGNFQV